MKALRLIFKITLYFLGAIVMYLFIALLGTLIPYGGGSLSQQGDVLVFIQSNGTHTDWVLPIRQGKHNWLEKLPKGQAQQFDQYAYIAFGWGDREFYRQSKASPTTFTALKALFYPSISLMHIKLYQHIPQTSDQRVAFRISQEQYQKLCQFIDNQFIMGGAFNFELIETGYGSRDFFFEARGRYHLLNTCNNWTNRGLKTVGIKTGIWTPFAQSVWYWVKKN